MYFAHEGSFSSRHIMLGEMVLLYYSLAEQFPDNKFINWALMLAISTVYIVEHDTVWTCLCPKLRRIMRGFIMVFCSLTPKYQLGSASMYCRKYQIETNKTRL